jgi:DNA-binding PucR family transcriptional regulator
MESLPAGQPGARQLDDPPLGELVMGSFETTRRVVQRILHGVLALPADERDTLLSTAEVWLGAGGSAAEAGRIMYCHENTVRYRLHKLEQYLGRPLDDPTAIAELTTALHGLRTFPALRDPSSEQL